jgi:hypothetical protein
LVGRDQDLAAIGEFVAAAAVRGLALSLSGEPGVGKSALLDAAEELAVAAGIRVLRAAGSPAEDVSYCGLNQVLLPLHAELDRLGDLQRNTLNVALGWAGGQLEDRLVVGNATLALLRQAAAAGPLLVIVDDLHWLDRTSACAGSPGIFRKRSSSWSRRWLSTAVSATGSVRATPWPAWEMCAG